MNYGAVIEEAKRKAAYYNIQTADGLARAQAEQKERVDFIPFTDRRDYLTKRGWTFLFTSNEERKPSRPKTSKDILSPPTPVTCKVSWFTHPRLSRQAINQTQALMLQMWDEMSKEGLFGGGR